LTPAKKAVADLTTQYSRALHELGIALICADTAPAKGRVERANKTLQGLLIKMMRIDSITGMSAGNAHAPAFTAAFNARFGRVPANSKDLHRPLDDGEHAE